MGAGDTLRGAAAPGGRGGNCFSVHPSEGPAGAGRGARPPHGQSRSPSRPRPGRPLSSPARASPACRPHPAPLLARHARTVHSGEPRRLPRAPPSSARVTRGPSGRAEVPQDPPASCSKASPEPCPEPEPGVHEPLGGPPVRPALPAAGPGRPDRWPACSCSTQLVLGGCFGDSSPRPGGPPGLPCGELFPPRPSRPGSGAVLCTARCPSHSNPGPGDCQRGDTGSPRGAESRLRSPGTRLSPSSMSRDLPSNVCHHGDRKRCREVRGAPATRSEPDVCFLQRRLQIGRPGPRVTAVSTERPRSPGFEGRGQHHTHPSPGAFLSL